MELFSTLLREKDVIEREGIFVDKHIAERTVWDKLAEENPEHAVISASTTADVARKSEDQISELLAELKDGVVLDFGSGYGRIAEYLLPKRIFAGYIGMDSSYNMLKLFGRRYHANLAEERTPLLLLNADIHTVPLNNMSIDNVIVAAVFLHNHKSVVEQAIEEIHRVLKPGGKVFVYGSFPNKWSLMGLQGSCYQMFLNLTGNPFKNGPVRYYGKREVARLFADFTDIDIRPVGFALLPKRLIFLPASLDRLWRLYIANPVNGLLSKLWPGASSAFPTHFDVISSK